MMCERPFLSVTNLLIARSVNSFLERVVHFPTSTRRPIAQFEIALLFPYLAAIAMGVFCA